MLMFNSRIPFINIQIKNFARNISKKSNNLNIINTTIVNPNEKEKKELDYTFEEFSLRNKIINEKTMEKSKKTEENSKKTMKDKKYIDYTKDYPTNVRREYKVDTDNKNDYLVAQPKKNFRWGDKNEVMVKENFFIKGKIPDYYEIVKYLESWKMKDIIVFPTVELGFNHLKEYSILATGYNNKHIYKCSREFLRILKSLNIEINKKENEEKDERMERGIHPNQLLSIQGRKHDELMRFDIGEVEVFLFTENGRFEADLEYKWTNKSDVDKIELSNKVMSQYKSKYRKYKY